MYKRQLKKIATKENADSLHKVIDKNKDDIQRLTPEEMNRRRTGCLLYTSRCIVLFFMHDTTVLR